MIKECLRGGPRNYLSATVNHKRPEAQVFDMTDIFEERVKKASALLAEANVSFTEETFEEFYPLDMQLPEGLTAEVSHFISEGHIGTQLSWQIDRLAFSLAQLIDMHLEKVGRKITFSHADTIAYAKTKGKYGYLFLVVDRSNRTITLQAETSFRAE